MGKPVTCPRCKAVGHYYLVDTPIDSPHSKKRICKECGASCGFEPKPKNETKRKRNKYSAEDLGIDYCQVCLRPKSRLGKGETLEPHHVKEIQHGGEDVPENIWIVCTYCHKVIHNNRIYLHEHFKTHISQHTLHQLMEEHHVPLSVRESMSRLLEAATRHGQVATY